MGVWRVTVSGAHGFDLGDDLPQLLDLRFADEIILFARSAAEAAAFVDFFGRGIRICRVAFQCG